MKRHVVNNGKTRMTIDNLYFHDMTLRNQTTVLTLTPKTAKQPKERPTPAEVRLHYCQSLLPLMHLLSLFSLLDLVPFV